MPRIVPNLWFDTESEEAAAFYVSIFPNAAITGVSHYTEAGPRPAGMVLAVEFVLDGQPFCAINGGTQFTFDEAVSFAVECADQEELDRYWARLTDGGAEGPCGWCTDRYGVSWQVLPAGWSALMRDADPARRNRAMTALFGMRKIDIAAIMAAADG